MKTYFQKEIPYWSNIIAKHLYYPVIPATTLVRPLWRTWMRPSGITTVESGSDVPCATAVSNVDAVRFLLQQRRYIDTSLIKKGMSMNWQMVSLLSGDGCIAPELLLLGLKALRSSRILFDSRTRNYAEHLRSIPRIGWERRHISYDWRIGETT